MNLAEDDAVNKLVNLSTETTELIRNCEKAAGETKLFKPRSKISEEEITHTSKENEVLKKVNECLHNELYEEKPLEECWISIVENANQTLNCVTPKMVQILEKLNASENTRFQLEQELVTLKKEMDNLKIEVEEKDLFTSKQSFDFLNLKKVVDCYQSDILRLENELQNCQSRVSTLDEHLEVINAKNLDLADYTKFKTFLKKYGIKEDMNEVITKLQTVYEIEEFCDKKLSPCVGKLTNDQIMESLIDFNNHNAVNKVKNCLEKTLFVMKKLNDSNVCLGTENENKIQTINDVNSTANEFANENFNQLAVTGEALRYNFEQLKYLFRYSCHCNDMLFAKFSQLHSWCRILKIRILKLLSQSKDRAEKTPLPPLSIFMCVIDELFDNVAEKRLDFNKRLLNLNQMFVPFKTEFDTNNYLKNTGDDMTLEMKCSTNHLEQQMARKIQKIELLKGEMDLVRIENCQLANKIKNCNQEIISLSTKNYELNEKLSRFPQIENDNKNLRSELLLIKNKLAKYEDIHNKNQYKELVSIHLSRIFAIAQDLKSSHKLLSSSVRTSIQDFSLSNKAIQQNIQQTITHSIEHVKHSTTLSNEEVIKEMQEELKKRSETIFKLNQQVAELTKENNSLFKSLKKKQSQIDMINDDSVNVTHCSTSEIIKKENEIADISATLEKTKALLRLREDNIIILENEISRLKEAQAADGDVSSMGNISRTEEVSRLRDVEDTFEERYTKLRCIAVKMKKNIADLNQQLMNEKSARDAVQCKLNIATEQAKRNQVLQEECDRVTDELELKMKEIIELKKIIIEADKKNEKNESLARQYKILEAQKTNLETEKRSLTSLVQELREEKFVEETLKKEMEKEIQQLKQKFKENEDSVKRIQNDLEQANFEVRKRGTLTLEMRDYEKTMLDLTNKLEAKNRIIEELNAKININVESNMSLLEHVKGLEGQISSFGISSKLADEQILNLNKIISAQERESEMKDNLLKQSKEQLEEEKLKNEVLGFQLAESVINSNDMKETLENVQTSFKHQLKLSQNAIKILEEELKKKENQFDKLKEDFETYKIRAHNVLQKHKNENNLKNNEEKLKMKIDDLSQTVKELRKRLDDTLIHLDNYKAELKLLQASKEKLLEKLKDIQKICAEKTRELDSVNTEFKSYKLNNENLIKYYKDKIENLHVSCQELNRKLQNLKLTNECEIAVEENNKITDQVEMQKNKASAEKPDTHLLADDNLLLSDAVNLVHVQKHQELVSLEKLLKTDSLDEQQDIVSNDVAVLRKKIEKLENQIAYLNGILNESEKNAARSEQNVAWLKDVNRHLQKTIDRAPHLQNGEYLKNVLFNFFTFPDGEEKCKLITILETLLQLTPEEKGILSAIAKGDRSEQKRSSGFSSFLRFG